MMDAQLNIDFTTAREAGHQAANACLAKAEDKGFDSAGAGKFIVGWLARHGETPGEELTDQAKRHGFRPHSDKAFGSIYATLVRRKLIRCVGFCLRKKGHSTAGGRVWSVVR